VPFWNSREKPFTRSFVLVARGGPICVGYVIGLWNDGGTGCIYELCTREKPAVALRERLIDECYRKLARQGVHTVYAEYPAQDHGMKRAFQRAGCALLAKGNVCMMKIQRLRQYLHAITPVLSRRVARSTHSWSGNIKLQLADEAACLQITRAKVTVVRRRLPCDVTISGSYDAMTQVLLGSRNIESAYKNREIDIKPKVGFDLLFFLNDLFPEQMWFFPHQVENV